MGKKKEFPDYEMDFPSPTKRSKKKPKKKSTPKASPAPPPPPIVDPPEVVEEEIIAEADDSIMDTSTSSDKPKKGNKSASSAAKKKRASGKAKDGETSSEEERWLDAIESGKLEEVDDELKKIKPKDPKLMTARQRAMYERNTEKELNPFIEELVSLPTGYKEKVMTAEAIQKAQLKSQKRKQLADEKREKDKKKTMERLLKKQDSKSVKAIKNRPVKAQIPRISYRMTVEGATISLPPGIEFPLQPQVAREAPKPTICGVPGCKSLKRYSCSKTGTPLCSLECYKKNFELIKRIIC